MRVRPRFNVGRGAAHPCMGGCGRTVSANKLACRACWDAMMDRASEQIEESDAPEAEKDARDPLV